METLWTRRPEVQGLRLSISPGLSRRSSQDQGLLGHVAVRQYPQVSKVTKCKQLLPLNILKGSKCALNLYSVLQSYNTATILLKIFLVLLLFDKILEGKRCHVKILVPVPASVDMI